MLLLTFRSGDNLYAIDARRVAQVVPRVELRRLPGAPGYLAGVLGYRGGVVPVVDFGALTGGPPAPEALSSRLILAEFTAAGGETRLVGIVAEGVSRVAEVAADRFVGPAAALDGVPYLGALVRLDEGLAQLVGPDKLLSERVQDSLYLSPAGPA